MLVLAFVIVAGKNIDQQQQQVINDEYLWRLFMIVFRFDLQQQQGRKCKIPPSAPIKIQKVINQCQDEIKLAIISGKWRDSIVVWITNV